MDVVDFENSLIFPAIPDASHKIKSCHSRRERYFHIYRHFVRCSALLLYLIGKV